MSKRNGTGQEIKRFLHSKGLRLTKQRKIVLETLKKSSRHFSVDELYTKILKKTLNISLTTIYRNLKIWAEEGFIAEIKFGKYGSRFNRNLENHYHISCQSCGEIEDICLKVKGLEAKARCLSDYKVLSHRIDFTGICPKCKKITSIQK